MHLSSIVSNTNMTHFPRSIRAIGNTSLKKPKPLGYKFTYPLWHSHCHQSHWYFLSYPLPKTVPNTKITTLFQIFKLPTITYIKKNKRKKR